MSSKKQKTKVKEPTLHDVLAAISTFATGVEGRFQGIDKKFDAVDKKFDVIDKKFDVIDKKFDTLEKKFDSLEEDVLYLRRNMITKDYLDERHSDLRGAITELVHKEDRKLVELIYLLENKDILSEEDAVRILSLPPFPLH